MALENTPTYNTATIATVNSFTEQASGFSPYQLLADSGLTK
jgi:hypothetical protein